MKFKIGKFYKLIFDISGHTITFLCKIDDIDGDFVSFTDKFNKHLTYNIKNIISYEELKNGS